MQQDIPYLGGYPPALPREVPGGALSLRVETDPPIPVVIVSGNNPYTWLEVINQPNNTWVTVAGVTRFGSHGILAFGDLTVGSNVIANVNTAGVSANQSVSGLGIAADTVVNSVGGSSVTLNKNATLALTQSQLNFNALNPLFDRNGNKLLQPGTFGLMRRGFLHNAALSQEFIFDLETIGVQDTQWCTTLAADITSLATSLMVTNVALFPAAGSYTIKVDDEQMSVTAGAGTPNWTLTRGVNGTIPAPHSQWSPVCLVGAIATTTTSSLSTTAVSVPVSGLSNFPTMGRFYAQIDAEIILVTNGAGTLSWSALRGQLGTIPATHANGAVVTWLTPDKVIPAQMIVFEDYAFVQPGNLIPNQVIHREVSQPIELVAPPDLASGNLYYYGYRLKRNMVTRQWEREIAVWGLDLDQ